MPTMTPKEIAEKLGSTPKVVRRFLRSLPVDAPGKGGKWGIDADAFDTLATRFVAWGDRTSRTITVDDLDDDA
jgi:hypothetical protein